MVSGQSTICIGSQQIANDTDASIALLTLSRASQGCAFCSSAQSKYLLQVTQPRQRDTEAVVFAWRQGVNVRSFRQALPSGVTRVIVHPTETAMLQAWLAWLQQADPDILNVFQVSMDPSLHEHHQE